MGADCRARYLFYHPAQVREFAHLAVAGGGRMGRGAPFLSLDAFSARGFDARQTTGIVLAVGGNLLVSVALNLTKHAHNVNQKRSVPLPYVRLPIWWCGFAATLLGELGNFAAYGFTEASVIAPLVSESPSPSLALLP